MNFTLHGKNLIAGEWKSGGNITGSTSELNSASKFSDATLSDIDAAARAAEEAFWNIGYSERSQRAKLLNTIAEEIDNRANHITEIGMQETGLPQARLVGERGRTTTQLRLFAKHILKGNYLDLQHDEALPNRQPAPRPDIQALQRPIGPVAVFGASNFPLAFSVAGGDTAAALAAGCPVIVKGHPAHPGVCEIVADAIQTSVKSTNFHPGTFSMIHGASQKVGAALVQHPLIKGVGFTGSLHGGRALFNLCANRSEPIPFFGELGSINPVFLFAGALRERLVEIGNGWIASLTMGAGQFCTKPGVVFVPEHAEGMFTSASMAALSGKPSQTMLTDYIAQAFQTGCERISNTKGISTLIAPRVEKRAASPALYKVSLKDWISEPSISEEVFGPIGIVIVTNDESGFVEAVQQLEGQLTFTIHVSDEDLDAAKRVIPILERKAGRLVVNGFPTGVEVCDSMIHSGPYPASTNFGATSVGTLSIRRFLRPVCYQNFPVELLPGDCRAT